MDKVAMLKLQHCRHGAGQQALTALKGILERTRQLLDDIRQWLVRAGVFVIEEDGSGQSLHKRMIISCHQTHKNFIDEK